MRRQIARGRNAGRDLPRGSTRTQRSDRSDPRSRAPRRRRRRRRSSRPSARSQRPSPRSPAPPAVTPNPIRPRTGVGGKPQTHRRQMTVAVLAKLRTILLHQAKVRRRSAPIPRPVRSRRASHAAEGLLAAGSHDGQASTPAYLVCASGTFDYSSISVPPGRPPATRRRDHNSAFVVLRQGLRVTELSLRDTTLPSARLGA